MTDPQVTYWQAINQKRRISAGNTTDCDVPPTSVQVGAHATESGTAETVKFVNRIKSDESATLLNGPKLRSEKSVRRSICDCYEYTKRTV